MSGNLIAIGDLPAELSYDDAIEAVYGDDLDWIESKLRQRLSVRVECDKQLTLYFYRALRTRFEEKGLSTSSATIATDRRSRLRGRSAGRHADDDAASVESAAGCCFQR